MVIRVSGGAVRGRRILTPGDMIRPTQEKVRQALFSTLATRISGCRFLDLFAGSGSVGLEAWSRGAELVCWVERDPRVAAVLKRNVTSLCYSPPCSPEAQDPRVGRVRVVTADAVRFIRRNATNLNQFDIIFADPPYADGQRSDWPKNILQTLMGDSILAPGGVFVVEQSSDAHLLECDWAPTKEKVYGGTQLRFWEK